MEKKEFIEKVERILYGCNKDLTIIQENGGLSIYHKVISESHLRELSRLCKRLKKTYIIYASKANSDYLCIYIF